MDYDYRFTFNNGVGRMVSIGRGSYNGSFDPRPRNPFLAPRRQSQGQDASVGLRHFSQDTTHQLTNRPFHTDRNQAALLSTPSQSHNPEHDSLSSRESSQEFLNKHANQNYNNFPPKEFKYEVLKCKGCRRVHGFQNQTIRETTFCSPRCLDEFSHLDNLPPMDSNSQLWYRMGQLSVMNGPFTSISSHVPIDPNGNYGFRVSSHNQIRKNEASKYNDNEGRTAQSNSNAGYGTYKTERKNENNSKTHQQSRTPEYEQQSLENQRANNIMTARLHFPPDYEQFTNEGKEKELDFPHQTKSTSTHNQNKGNNGGLAKKSNVGLFGKKKQNPTNTLQKSTAELSPRALQDEGSDWDNDVITPRSGRDQEKSKDSKEEKSLEVLNVLISKEIITKIEDKGNERETKENVPSNIQSQMPECSSGFKTIFFSSNDPKPGPSTDSFKGATLLNAAQTLVQLNRKEAKFPYPNISFGKRFKVGVSFTESKEPPLVFVHLLENEKEFSVMMDRILCHKMERKLTRITNIKRGIICLAPFGDDLEHFSRVEVLEVKHLPENVPGGLSQTRAVISFVDFGNVTEVSKDVLYVLPPEFLDVPRYAIQVDCRHFTFESMDDLVKQIEAESVYIVGVTREGLAIITTSFQTMEECASVAERKLMMYDELKLSDSFKTGNLATIEHVVDYQQYIIRCEQDLDALEEMNLNIMNASNLKKLDSFDQIPSEGLILLGEYVDKENAMSSIERICVNKVNGNYVKVYYLDRGVKDEISLKKLFYPTKDIMKYPRFGLKVKLLDVPNQTMFNRMKAKASRKYLEVTNSILQLKFVDGAEVKDDCKVELCLLVNSLNSENSLNEILITQYKDLQMEYLQNNKEK